MGAATHCLTTTTPAPAGVASHIAFPGTGTCGPTEPNGRASLRSGTGARRSPPPTVMAASAAVEPMKLTHLPQRMASRAAMKKVLSPSSLMKMRLRGWGAVGRWG